MKMLLFVTLFGTLALAMVEAQHNIFRTDLDPDEAAKYLNNPPFINPQLAPRTNVLPLIKYNDPRFRSAEAGPTLGHYWKNGQEIENPDDYVEEVYNARQYHGQDGLGAYAYGYETPESSKAEAKQRSGEVQGTYTYKAGSSNNLYTVRYWADSQGFHQEDNIPKYVPKPVEEAPDVKAARIAHEKAWQEAAYNSLHPGAAAAAAAAASQPQPQNNYNYNQNYNPNNQQSYDYQGGASGQYNAYSLPPSKLRRTRQAQYNQQYQGQYNQGQDKYNQYPGQDYSTTTTTTTPAPEPTGPPRGFFYSFEYPVSIIVEKKSQGQDPGNYSPGYPVDNDTFEQGQNYNK